MDTKVHSDEERNSIFSGLVDQMVAQGQLITVPQVPGQIDLSTGTTIPSENPSDQGTTDKAPKAATPAIKPAVPGASIDRNQSVTTSIANQGQLIPIPPPTTGGGTEDSLKDIKKLIGAVSGNSGATSSDSGGGKSGGDGGLDVIGDIAQVALAFVGWIICTELMRQGKMPRKWWIKGAPVFAAYPEFVKQGYYLWAIPCVAHLRAKPNSLFSRALCVVFNARARSIATGTTIQGATVTAILWPICWTLGAVMWLLNVELDGLSVYGVKN